MVFRAALVLGACACILVPAAGVLRGAQRLLQKVDALVDETDPAVRRIVVSADALSQSANKLLQDQAAAVAELVDSARDVAKDVKQICDVVGMVGVRRAVVDATEDMTRAVEDASEDVTRAVEDATEDVTLFVTKEARWARAALCCKTQTLP
jgi:gas vesicle protein